MLIRLLFIKLIPTKRKESYHTRHPTATHRETPNHEPAFDYHANGIRGLTTDINLRKSVEREKGGGGGEGKREGLPLKLRRGDNGISTFGGRIENSDGMALFGKKKKKGGGRGK